MSGGETARKILLPGEPDPAAVAAAHPQGTIWDKPAPTGPPNKMERQVSPEFKPIVDWMQQVVLEESLVADLALERAIEIVEFNHNRGFFGIDAFTESGAGGAAPRTNLVAMAVPLAVELYKQSLLSINQRKEELKELMRNVKTRSGA